MIKRHKLPKRSIFSRWFRKIYSTEMDLWWNIRNIWGHITYPFAKFFDRMVKIVQYIPILWKDYDWDHMYFFVLMQYKLKRMRQRILKNNMIVRAEEIAAQIKHAEDLIEKWLNDDFCKEEYEAHEKKWGEMVDLSTPLDDGSGLWEWDMSREKCTTPELKQQESDESMAIHNKCEQERQKCLDDIFNHLRNHVQEWWD